MIKPYAITQIKDDADIEKIDNLFRILFRRCGDKEIKYLEFTGSGVWATPNMIGEKELVLCENKTDNILRLYTKVAGVLRYIQFM